MKKAAKFFLNGALVMLGALGLAGQSAGNAQAGERSEAATGDDRGTFPRYIGAPGSEQGKPETYLNSAKILTKEKAADSLFGGNRTWRVDKNKAKSKTIPDSSKTKSK